MIVPGGPAEKSSVLVDLSRICRLSNRKVLACWVFCYDSSHSGHVISIAQWMVGGETMGVELLMQLAELDRVEFPCGI